MTLQYVDKPKYPNSLNSLVPDASLIFKGKVILLNTTTTDKDDVSDKGEVLVEHVIDAPENFPDFTGDQITVQFLDIEDLQKGDERMFIYNSIDLLNNTL